MLSKYDYDKILKTVKNVGISVGTQILHLNHVMHGIDPVALKKGDMITAYALFMWENHRLEDLEGYVPDIATKRLAQAASIVERRSIQSDILDSITKDVSYTKKIDKDIKQINEDYNIALDAVEKISSGHIEDIDLNKISEVASHINEDEISNNTETLEDDLEFVHHELHDSVNEEVQKRKEYEQRIYSIMDMKK